MWTTVLVIILIAGPYGGRTVDTSLRFTSIEECEVAKAAINAAHAALANNFAQPAPLMVCVRPVRMQQ